MLASEFSSGLEDGYKKIITKKHKLPGPSKLNADDYDRNAYVPSLFRHNPEIPRLKANADVKPIVEPLFSCKTFKDIPDLHPHMIANLEHVLCITKVTSIQEQTMPVIQNGSDALVRSQTGSGKTLAYAIPIVEELHKMRPKICRKDGLKVVVVLPSRELALQTYECFLKLVKPFLWLVPGLIVGGEKRKSEKARLRKGINILVGTPGRLLDHAKNTQSVSFNGVKWLIIDEADRMLEMGYEKDVKSIIDILDAQNESRRQTILLSATLTTAVERLASLSLKDPVRVGTNGDILDDFDLVIPDCLEQRFIIVPAKLRLVTLASLLLTKCLAEKSEGKILVFMGTQLMVDYHAELFATVLTNVNFYKLHGKMSQAERTEVFRSFRSYDTGVLMCSDVVARGVDFPKVDWIVQYTAPISTSDYVHRVGRTARVGIKGNAMLFLAPHEINFVDMLREHKVSINEEKMDKYLTSLMNLNFENATVKSIENAATTLQIRFETAVADQRTLHDLSCEAYTSWVRFYASYPLDMRDAFNFKGLHLGHYAKSFALNDAPKQISGIGKRKFVERKREIHKQKGGERSANLEKRPRWNSGEHRSKEISEFDTGFKLKWKMKKQ